ncbi:glycosyltransferase family 2 protein [Methylobacterium nonmethylotrophicum]|nr:glycosyltransferase family 2 protein [Methylobacterium nonmethylotrophicum]
MRGTAPPVTVVLPLRADVPVGPALASLRGQSFGDYEAVLVGDGAREAAAEAADPRVRALRAEGSGRAAARNRGVTAARAEWIAFLDPGDVWREDHLAELLAATRFGDAVAVFGNPVRAASGRTLLAMSVPSGRVPDLFAFSLRVGCAPVRASAALIERAAAIDAGLFPAQAGGGADLDLWGRLALQGLFRYVARPTAILAPVAPARRPSAPPLLAATLAQLLDEGAVPADLMPSARRYRNRLMLDHARRLAAAGCPAEARAVLARACTPGLDPLRHLAALARTWRAGWTGPAPGALAGSP